MKMNKIALLSLAVLLQSSPLLCSLFGISVKKQTMTIDCYKDVNINATVAEGGSLVIATGDCYIEAAQVMGKFGDIITLANLPTAINIGQGAIPASIIQSATNIQTPANGQKALLSFVPSMGQLARQKINFVIEHVAAANLDAEIKARGLEKAAAQFKADNPGQAIEMFVFYRSLPGVTAGWFDLGQQLTVAGNISPNFNVAVDASGKLMISSSGSDNVQLFDLGQFQIQSADAASKAPQTVAQTFKSLLDFKRQGK